MSGFSLFHLKYPSLLSYSLELNNDLISVNLKDLYGISRAPSDTRMRERLDVVSPVYLRVIYKKLFSLLQRSNHLKRWSYYDDHYLLSLDGTGYFLSPTIHCEDCCEKHLRNGKVQYFHNMLVGALVHPEMREVVPFAPEAICKEDGSVKNDCERNASVRFLADFRREHPHLKTIVVADALSSNGPFLEMLNQHDLRYIIGVKPKGNKVLFSLVDYRGSSDCEMLDEEGITHRFRYANDIPLNAAQAQRHKVNFFEYWQIGKEGKEERHFSWITDITITNDNIFQLMKAGRARWKIENETFNTLKNQGYHFEHNFGHGNKHLANLFASLMMLAFFVDQIIAASSKTFQQALKTLKAKTRIWEYIRGVINHYYVKSWERVYQSAMLNSKKMFLNSS